MPLFCSYHILTSSVIYYWTDARQHVIYLLNSIICLDFFPWDGVSFDTFDWLFVSHPGEFDHKILKFVKSTPLARTPPPPPYGVYIDRCITLRQPKKKRDTRTTGAIVSHGHKYFAHTQKNNEKLVLICPTPLYPQPPGPRSEALDFSRRLPRGRMVEDKKELAISLSWNFC